MACDVVGLGSVGDCTPNAGGITRSVGTKLSNITGATITSGVISAFTMSTTGLWKAFIYDKDATANFSQTGTVENNVFKVEQAAFMKFKGISQTSIAAANSAKDCCDVVFVHFLANGTALVQGFEYLTATVTATPEGTTNRNTRIIPNVITGTTAEEARTEYNVTGNSLSFTNTTSLTYAALLAL